MNTPSKRSDDEVRDLILRHLYTSHRNARGRSGGAITITELQKAMRTFGLKQQDVGHNLDYLVQKGWIERWFRSGRSPRREARSSPPNA